MKRKLFALVSAVCILLVFLGGCASRTAATVNGTRIYYSELYDKIDQSLAEYGTDNENLEDFLYDMLGDADEAKNEANAYRDSMLDNVILSKLMMQKASELGFDQLTDEERENAIAEADANLGYYRDFYKMTAEDAAAEDPTIDVDAYAEEKYQEFLDTAGITEDAFRQSYIDNAIMGKVYDYYADQFKATEDDYVEYYNKLLEEQQSLDESDPDQALYYYLNNGYDVNVYIPKNAADEVETVEHILIAFDEETAAKLDELALSEDEEDAKEEERLLQKSLNDLKPQADEIMAKINAGENFEKLMEEYSADYHDFTENLYDVYEGANFVESFKEASLALKNIGDVSEPVSSDYGWHIIKLVSVPTPGPIAYDDVKDELKGIVDEELEAEHWQEILDGWLEEADVSRITFLEEKANS